MSRRAAADHLLDGKVAIISGGAEMFSGGYEAMAPAEAAQRSYAATTQWFAAFDRSVIPPVIARREATRQARSSGDTNDPETLPNDFALSLRCSR
ncbi:MAG TPA: hypothetical protein VMB34_16485 [Acetobacteraceae bacterium]|nr:hypothetical protein [Acetobacteraceae bacterium]